MDDEIVRQILADALARQHDHRGWIFSPDHSVPSDAQMYMVYDGIEAIGGGITVSRVSDLVGRSKMAIVFYQPAVAAAASPSVDEMPEVVR